MKALRSIVVSTALLAAGCDRVEFIELSPDVVVLKQANNEAWMQAKAMAHTGQQQVGASIGWSIKDPTIATIDNTGKMKPLKSGHTEVVAKHKEVTASVPVDVLFVEKIAVEPTELTLQEGGESVELKAKAFDYQGRLLKDRTPTFKSSDGKIVSMGQNAAFGLTPGSATVEVQIDGVKASVKVTVEADKKKK